MFKIQTPKKIEIMATEAKKTKTNLSKVTLKKAWGKNLPGVEVEVTEATKASLKKGKFI